MSRVLVTGAGGQLGKKLLEKNPSYVGVTRAELDVADLDQCRRVINEINPDVVINAAAFTNVDRAEIDREECYRTNVVGVRNLYQECFKNGSRLIHVSTDHVFNYSSSPFTPYCPTDPANWYGETKRLGELEIESKLVGTIVRTSWLYSEFQPNFVLKVLDRLKEGEVLSIPVDQGGSPTNINTLTEVLSKLVSYCPPHPVFHVSDLGGCSKYDFALHIRYFGIKHGLLENPPAIIPIMSPKGVKRPALSMLDPTDNQLLFGIVCKDWTETLEEFIAWQAGS